MTLDKAVAPPQSARRHFLPVDAYPASGGIPLLGAWRAHTAFQGFLVRELTARPPSDRPRIEHHADLLETAWLLDLDPALPILAPHYASHGRPSHQAPEVLRSLLLMTYAGQTSIPRWHKQMTGEPILAIACGFLPHDVAPVSTLYALCDRLWPQRTGPATRRPSAKPKRPSQGDDKLPNKHTGVVGRLFAQASEGRRFAHRPERFLQELMARVVVDVSAEQGLLGDPQRMSVAIDGAPLETGASPHGKRICRCERPPGASCDCARRFQDADARWGWDSYHKRYYYGYTLYHVTAADSPYDLPLYLRLPQAPRNDSVTGFVSLVETIDMYPDWTLRRLLGDSAHDNAPTYKFCYQHHIAPYIDENQRHSGKSQLPPAQGYTAEGVPLCPAGHPMASDGFCPGRNRQKWRCPNRAGCATPCSPSPYGRVVYTYPNGSLREPPVPRNSDAFRKAYKRRTAVERSLKRTLVDRHVEASRVRRKHHWYWRSTLCAMAQHLDAWIAERRRHGLALLAWLSPGLANVA